MAVLNGLVPARFLTIIAHLVLIIVLFWSRDDNVRACLPRYYTNAQYEEKDTQLIIGLSVSLALFLLELIGFISGLSMFLPSQGFISTFAHALAAISLAYFIQDSWECHMFWYIFGFCSCMPALVEIGIFMAVCCSIAAHASAAVTMVFFLFDQWCSDSFWYVFGFCSALPAVTEIAVLIGVLVMEKRHTFIS